ncbi:MAG: hypothetical protein Q9187_006040 [Circinaria calcarea]
MAGKEYSVQEEYMLSRGFRESARCWLLELARHVPTSWTLDGFDVSSEQYPAMEYLPENISLQTLDAFDDLPAELIGQFDVVHIRAFAVVVKQGDPGPLLMNMIALLSMPDPLDPRGWMCM